MNFIIIKSKKKLLFSEISQIKKEFYKKNFFLEDALTYEWVSDDKKTIFLGKNPNVAFNEMYETFNITKDNKLSFICGWLKKFDEDKLLIANEISNLFKFDNLDGFFAIGSLNSKGNGEVYTNFNNTNLYYAKSKDMYAISTNKFLLNKFFNDFNQKKIKSYKSKKLKSNSSPNICKAPPKCKFELNKDLIINESPNFYNLENDYFVKPKKFWEKLYKNGVSQVNSFEEIFSQMDDFPLNSNNQKMEYKPILFYDKGIKEDYNNNWNSEFVMMIREQMGTVVKRVSGNWFVPLSNNSEYFLPSKFKLDIDVMQHNSAPRIVLSNNNREFISKKFIDLGIPTTGGHLTIIYNEGEITFKTVNAIINENCDLGSDGIGINIDLWGGNKFIFKELVIQSL